MFVSCSGHEVEGEGILQKLRIKLRNISLTDFTFCKAPSLQLAVWILAKNELHQLFC